MTTTQSRVGTSDSLDSRSSLERGAFQAGEKVRCKGKFGDEIHGLGTVLKTKKIRGEDYALCSWEGVGDNWAKVSDLKKAV